MLKIYHNPRCSKSRETLELLKEKGQQVDVVEYLKTPPTALELKQLLQWLNISARQLLRTKEDEYKALGLDNETLSEQQLIDAMAAHPKLIERPIVVNGNKAAIGRPATNVLNILS
ncbi:MAG: arsenate reductase (glutaredoxin) [Alteromonadaceae bacterium]|jgi:arsenate reductase|uniref:Arsenate reductase n=1 Tax=Rheinheimera aquimaris TaxID=412437 RepID=A0ABP3PAM2_9GAMM|nr:MULTISPECIES: arsenate reductase (glutaredoxin) [Rheinheimera]MBJ92065.1 arsenate reductase (glutaredoxin) [Alteromonadaceae bacterium]MCB5215388.1 arsenate reductase (glutaredoxin) [Rheinheimera aquimaris]HBN89570.1 arsenate reductase (glutaredoxin) [Rheinheimera sp.]|tara:strand:- start:6477 stop:6824 length:348 start_codon:yes stop_codon:yes gene_type:complete